jgi:hypothetical protein
MSNMNLSVMKSQTGSASISTGYDLLKKVSLHQDLFARSQINFLGSLLEIQCSNISGATKITCCLSRDSTGDDIVLTSTETTLQNGLTTSSRGCGLIRLDVILQDVNDAILWLHVKTNAGTLDIDSARLTFRY